MKCEFLSDKTNIFRKINVRKFYHEKRKKAIKTFCVSYREKAEK